MRKGTNRASIVRRAAHTVLESLESRRLLSAGSLDQSFGSGGIVTTQFSGPTSDQVQSAIHLNSGKSLAVGTSGAGEILARYNADGSRDTTFGNGGSVVISNSMLDEILSIKEQSDGKIVAAGELGGKTELARFNANGSLDSSFGSGGSETLSGVGDGAVDVAINPNGKIDVAVDDGGDFAVAQLNSDGSLDSSFGGGNGYTTIDFGSDQDMPNVIALGNDGIYVAGSTIQLQQEVIGGNVEENPYASVAIAELQPDGSLDNSFGSGGKFTQQLTSGNFTDATPAAIQILDSGNLLLGGTASSRQFVMQVTGNGVIDNQFGDGVSENFPNDGDGYNVVNPSGSGDNAGYGVATDSDGNIYLAGEIDENASITKFTSQGLLDTTFGTNANGAVEQRFASNSVYRSIWIANGNQLQVTGSEEETDGDWNFAQAVYNADGSLNTGFGNQGITTDGFTGPAGAEGRAVVQQSDGKLIAVGTAGDAAGTQIALTRYNADGSVDSSFGTNGEVVGSFAVQDVDGAVLTPDGHILVGFTTSNGSDTDLAVACFNSDGSLDTSFGNNGVAVHVDPNAQDSAIAVGISPSGDQVYVAGDRSDINTGAEDFEIVSFSTGTGNELASNHFSFNNDPVTGTAADLLTSMTVQSNGDVVLAGYSVNDNGGTDIALARVDSGLSLDGSFGNGGQVLDHIDDINQVMAVTTDSASNIYVSDVTTDSTSGDVSEGIVKYDGSGNRITSGFGDADGLAEFSIGDGVFVTGISVGSDGSITLGGTVQHEDSGLSSDGAARFTADGQLDSSFGNGGTTDVTVNDSSDAPGFAVQADGNIVLLGGSDGDFAAVRLQGSTAQQAPPPVANAGPDQTVNEGSTVNFDGSASTGDHLTYSWDLNGDGTFGDATGPTASYTYTDNGAVTVSLQVTDAEGRMSVDTLNVTVNNVAPTASVSGPSSLVPGQTGTFTFGANDPSSVDQASNFTYDINWGDGTPDMIVVGSSNISENHVFTTNANDTVTVMATDKDDGQSAAATTGVAINAPATVTATEQPDPLNPGQTMLVVQGTAGNDVIELDHSQQRVNKVLVQTLTVMSNGVAIFSSTTPYSRIQVFANSGDDSVTHGGGFKHAVEEFGGAGNDTLKAGQSGDILVGGDGDDSLVSGAGNDVEFGGAGMDKIAGDAGQDILVSGITSFDNDPASLDAISAEWNSTRSFASRVANLQGSNPNSTDFAARLNGNVFLIADAPNATVFDDGVKDTLNGGGTDSDWLLFNSTGGVVDKAAGNTTGDVLEDIS